MTVGAGMQQVDGVRSGRSWRIGSFLVAMVGYALCLAITPIVQAFTGTRHGTSINLNLWMILPTFPLMAALTMRGVREVRVAGQVVELEERAGTVLRFGPDEVGGMGFRGSTVFGRLVHGPSGWGSMNGCVVVVDPWGRQLAARPAGFYSVRELRELCERTGIRWVDACVTSVPLVPLPAPTFDDPPPTPGSPALDDEATIAGLGRARWRRRAVLAAYAGTFALGWISAATYDRFPDRSVATVALATLAWICLPLGFLLLVLAPLNERRPSRYRRALRQGSWTLVEAVALDGLGSDKSVRLVGICHPGAPDRTLPTEWWRARAGGADGWLGAGARHWAWLARSADGGAVVLAPLDRRDFAALAVDAKARSAADVAIAEYEAAGVALGLIAPPTPPGGGWPAPAPPAGAWPAPVPPADAWPAPVPHGSAPGADAWPPPAWGPPAQPVGTAAGWPAPAPSGAPAPAPVLALAPDPAGASPPPGWAPPPATWGAPASASPPSPIPPAGPPGPAGTAPDPTPWRPVS